MNLRAATAPAMTETRRVPMLIGGDWRFGDAEYDVLDPYRGAVVSRAPRSTAADVDAAVSAAVAAKAAAAAMPGYERAALLHRLGASMLSRLDEIAETIARETGKCLKDARAEVARSQDTVRLSAEEAVRIEGEHIPLDAAPMSAGKIAMLLRFPVGVVAGITPFNAPFNLAAHKIAPALAAGNAIVLKASPQAPLSVHMLAELVVEAGVPAGFVNVLYGDEAGPLLVRDARVDFITFTGSTRAGAHIAANAGLRRVALELGGTGQTIVCADAKIEDAATMCARNAMRLAGQSCISVQNVYVHESLHDRFVDLVSDEIAKLKLGDPLDPETDVGTMIDEAAAERVESWIAAAAAAGARVVTGGTRAGAQVAPTLLTDVQPDMQVVCEEVFGPVVTVQPFAELEPLFRQISDWHLGLQCGIFTQSLETAIAATRRLRTGAVIVNGSSTWRVDQMPYGGIKDSGIGREGPRYAIRDMTDERVVVFNL